MYPKFQINPLLLSYFIITVLVLLLLLLLIIFYYIHTYTHIYIRIQIYPLYIEMVSRVDMQSRTCTKSRAPRRHAWRAKGAPEDAKPSEGKETPSWQHNRKRSNCCLQKQVARMGFKEVHSLGVVSYFFSLDNFCQWTGRVQRCQRLPVVFLLEQLSRATIDKIRTHELAPHAIRMPMIFTWRTHQLEWDTSMQISSHTHMICVFTAYIVTLH